MLGKVFGIITTLSFLIALITGNTAALGNAILDGAADAVTLTLSLAGIMCLWCGVMEVLREAGLITKLARLMRPFLRIFFPDSCGEGQGAEEIAANISANMLGIGNAATPLALSALEKMQKNNPDPSRPTNDMVTLAVMNTASVNLLPTTILALRRASGSQDPFSVILPIWLVSSVCWLLALVLARAVGSLSRKKNQSALICRKEKGTS